MQFALGSEYVIVNVSLGIQYCDILVIRQTFSVNCNDYTTFRCSVRK